MHDSRSRDHIDDAIDDVARTMTAGQPGESLRRVVGIRIDRQRQRRGGAPAVPMWKMGLAAASMAAMALAVGQNFLRPSEPGAPSGVGATRAAPGVTLPDPPVARAAPPIAAEAAPVQPRNQSGADAGVVPAVAALPAPRPLVIESLEVEPIGPQLMAVESIPDSMPIEIQPLRVEPLSMQ